MSDVSRPVVAVHGIAQQQLGRHQLAGTWQRALGDGVERATGRLTDPPSLDVAYYGDLFLPPGDDGKSGGDPGDLGDLSAAEAAELTAAAYETLAAAPGAGTGDDKGFTRAPEALQVVIRALDRRFGPAMGALAVGELRQARRFLTDDALRAAALARIAAATGPSCTVLIGHSLGSVAALCHVAAHPDREWPLLLTLGSPLGLRYVHERPGLPRERPANVRRWVNVRDPHDPVAAAALAGVFGNVEEAVVDNGTEAHSATRYLGKRVVGAAVVAELAR